MYKNIIPAINTNISQSNKNTVILVYLPEKEKVLENRNYTGDLRVSPRNIKGIPLCIKQRLYRRFSNRKFHNY